MTHGHFESTFSKYAFGRGGGGHKKEYAVYARENDDNYGRPLSRYSVSVGFTSLQHLPYMFIVPKTKS